MSETNRQWLLKTRPVGKIGPEHFELVESPLPDPDLGAGQVLVKTLMLGFDPAMRGWLNEGKSYIAPVGIGEGSLIQGAIVDLNARIGRNVRIVNREGVQEADGDGWVIRDGIVVVAKDTVIPDDTTI